jgi:hypothetical protein
VSRVLSLATVGELLECKAQPQQTASPFSCTKSSRFGGSFFGKIPGVKKTVVWKFFSEE